MSSTSDQIVLEESPIEALLRDLHQFRATFDALPAAIYTTDAQGRLTFFNSACVAFSGRRPELGSDHWCVTWRLYYPDGRPMPHNECPMAIALREGRMVRGAQAIAERPDGTRIWFEPYPTLLYDEAGNIIGGINMLVDITERKQAEAANARLAAIVESSDDAIISKDLSGIITSWNASAQRLFGYTAQEAVGQSVTMLMPPDRIDEEEGILACIHRGQRIDHYETVRRRKDGKLLDISLTISPIVDERGKIIGASKIARDITDRKRAQRLMSCQKSALEQAALGKPLIEVLAALAQGIERNSPQQSMVAIHLLDRSGARFEQTIAPSLPPQYAAAIDGMEISSSAGPCCAAITGRKLVAIADVAAEHEQFPSFSAFALPLGIRAGWSVPILASSGQPLGTVAQYYHEPRQSHPADPLLGEIVTRTASVIIERSQTEEALWRTRQQAEDANRAKDKFLAMLSHELRTPLTPVLMTAAALEIREDVPPGLRDDLSMIRRNVELLSKLIDDLLDLSRITSGKLRLSFDIFSINDIVGRACNLCRPNLRQRGVRLHCQLAEDVLDVVGDSGRLQQVFWNLLNNAAKFTSAGGEVRVRTENVEGQEMVRISVRDSGIGIAAEDLGRIFNAFEQLETDGSRPAGGMGLGLSICKVLVEQHRGTIRAQSDGPGKGSTFIVELPALSREKLANLAPSPPSAGEADLPPLRLLIVEDHADTARALGTLLAADGHVVRIANSAADALALAEGEPFDIIISDLGLPDMTGYELMKQIRGKYPIRGIALSGYGMQEDIEKSEQAGFADHLVKPIKIVQLEESIRRISRNRGSTASR